MAALSPHTAQSCELGDQLGLGQVANCASGGAKLFTTLMQALMTLMVMITPTPPRIMNATDGTYVRGVSPLQ